MPIGRVVTAVLLLAAMLAASCGHDDEVSNNTPVSAPAGLTERDVAVVYAQGTDFATALLPDGTVLAIGGTDGNTELSSVERYNPAIGTWTPTGSLVQASDLLTATLLSNGKVLAAGGLAAGVDLYSDELYDPATGTWAQTASMSLAREQHTATLLADGSVLIAGGLGRGIFAQAELFH